MVIIFFRGMHCFKHMKIWNTWQWWRGSWDHCLGTCWGEQSENLCLSWLIYKYWSKNSNLICISTIAVDRLRSMLEEEGWIGLKAVCQGKAWRQFQSSLAFRYNYHSRSMHSYFNCGIWYWFWDVVAYTGCFNSVLIESGDGECRPLGWWSHWPSSRAFKIWPIW